MLHSSAASPWKFERVEARPSPLHELHLPETPALYQTHAAFVWRSLSRLGVPEKDREDLLQDVFVVAHGSRDSYRGKGKVTTWLYGISLRVAGTYRRRSRVRNEVVMGTPPEVDARETPESTVVLKQRALLLERILNSLTLKQRTVLVMFELEGLACEEIADELGVPVGTVYSRLHAAREQFASAWHEERRRGG